GGGGVLREENHRNHSPCESASPTPTPPSSGEPLSAPALSTQEASPSPVAGGGGGSDTPPPAAASSVGDAADGNGLLRGKERYLGVVAAGSGGSAGIISGAPR
ncbi:unnamed protein product, partial [Laminaria digitata]